MRILKSCILVSSMILGTSVGYADCLTKVAALQSWLSPTEQTLRCLADNQEFSEGMSILCDQNNSETSKSYQRYLAYQEVYNLAFAKYKAAQDIVARSVASIEMQNAKQDLNNYGIDLGIFSALEKISRAHSICTN